MEVSLHSSHYLETPLSPQLEYPPVPLTPRLPLNEISVCVLSICGYTSVLQMSLRGQGSFWSQM